MRAEP